MIAIAIAQKSNLEEVTRLRFLAHKHGSIFDPDAVISRNTKRDLIELTKREFEDPHIFFLLARESNRVIGLAILSLSPETDHFAFLGELFVEEKYRGKGLGEQLVQKAVELAKKQNIKNFRVTVARRNISAQKFYHKLGFHPKEREYLLFEKEL